MNGIHIAGTGRAVPKKTLTNDDLSKLVETNDAWITERTGIKSRYICGEENPIDLAYMAGKRAMECAGVKAEEIGVVLVATSTAKNAFPSTACMVQKKLGLNEDVVSFDLSAACTGFVYGLRVCRDMLVSSEKRYALLIGCEEMSRLIDYTDRSTCILFGDGAGAAVLELSDGIFENALFSKGDDELLFCKGAGHENAYTKMNGREVYKFAVTSIRKAIDLVLKKSDMTMEEVDYVVCHQANQRIIEAVAKKYHCDEKFFMNIEQYGNTSAASIPIAIDEMYEQGLLKKGMKILCVGFGAGLTWGSVLMEV